jgi:hypothetical protein
MSRRRERGGFFQAKQGRGLIASEHCQEYPKRPLGQKGWPEWIPLLDQAEVDVAGSR